MFLEGHIDLHNCELRVSTERRKILNIGTDQKYVCTYILVQSLTIHCAKLTMINFMSSTFEDRRSMLILDRLTNYLPRILLKLGQVQLK